ncbi:unnamed protein product [Heligmosomoides polygyrus]|uniref:Cytospin-A n=1 Tax=Heligmosomoides polygyrus TaxID=6339 RepID=A0A183F9U6_HELPZ|nr:unnamed protein product [Heligmosomoides polygyrus]
MVSPSRSHTIAAQRKSTRSQNDASSSSCDGAVEQLQALMGNGKTPGYVKLLVELLLETRAEIKVAYDRNAALVELQALMKENSLLKQKLADVMKSSQSSVPTPAVEVGHS